MKKIHKNYKDLVIEFRKNQNSKIKGLMFKNEGKELDMYIYGEIESDAYRDESISSLKIKKILDEFNPKFMNLHINSPGGDVFEAAAIYNLLLNKKAYIEVYIDSLAASAASIIAMVGNRINMYFNSIMMIHNVWTLTFGDADHMFKVAEDLKKINDTVIKDTYLKRFKGSYEELSELMDNETYLTPTDALKWGLIDQIIENNSKEETQNKDGEQNIKQPENYKENKNLKYLENFLEGLNTRRV